MGCEFIVMAMLLHEAEESRHITRRSVVPISRLNIAKQNTLFTMTTPTYILAHDLGTTGNKASLIDVNGKPLASIFAAYETAYLHPNWAEQDASDWERTLI